MPASNRRRVRLIAMLAATATFAAAAPVVAQTAPSGTATPQRSTGPATRMVVFGDSLADGGFYLPLDPRIPRDAGSFTTNPDPVAPEVVAARLGLPLLPVYGQGGTNYAVGGARIAAANGITVPVTNQISNFLATNPRFAPTDLVYVQGGGNDYFAFLAGGGRDPTILSTAATALATQVRRLQDAGAQRIVTMSIQSAGAAPVQSFNATFKAALAAQNVNALFVDVDRLFNEILTNPGTFGITNITNNACTVPSSLSCNRSTLVTPNANETYARADDVHPSGIVQRIQGQLIASLILAPEQVGNLSYAAQAAFRSQRDMLALPIRTGLAGGGRGVFGAVGYHYVARDSADQRIGFSERGVVATLGVDVPLGDHAGIGIAGGYGDGRGAFDGYGGYRSRYLSATGYARAGISVLHLTADATYGKARFRDIARVVTLGPSTRRSTGATDGDYVAARIGVAAPFIDLRGIAIGPEASFAYERGTIDAFAEAGTLSSDAAFGRQRLVSKDGYIGLVAQTPAAAPVHFTADGGYVHDFEKGEQTIAMTPAGAPISYVSGLDASHRDYWRGAMAVEGRVMPMLNVRGGVASEFRRGGFDRIAAHAGLALTF